MSVFGGKSVGLQPANGETLFDGTLEQTEAGKINEYPSPESFSNGAGNPVVHASNIYAIYWDPTDHYHGDWQGLIDGFLRGIGIQSNSLSSVFALDTQYTDTSNTPAYNRQTFRGAITDTDSYPASGCADPHPLQTYEAHHTYPIACLTDEQVSQELQSFITLHGLPTGMNTIFYILTPPGVAVCLDGGGPSGHCSSFESTKTEQEEKKFESVSYKNSFCSYHSDLNPDNVATGDGSTVLYSVIPWTAGGLADGQMLPADEQSAFYCQDGGFGGEGAREVSPVQQEPNQRCPGPDGFCDTGLADLIINQIAVEQQNVVTNPLLNAWQDPAGNEATDECRNFFMPVLGGTREPKPITHAGTLFNQAYGGGTYYVNTAFDLAALRLNFPGIPCLPGAALEPKFTAPNNVNAGDIVAFDGMESNISMPSAIGYSAGGSPQPNYATFTWNFGDGTPTVTGFAPGTSPCTGAWLSPCAAGVFHAYTYGGTYQVTLTVTDVGGNTASFSSSIAVIGPLPPAPVSGSGSGSGAGSGSTSGSVPGSASGSTTSAGSVTQAGGSSSSPAVPVPNPVAAAAVASRSLRRTLRTGLVIRYSVNEQVAGHFDVLLSHAIAHHLGIGGAPARGLPAGTPPQVTIGKAVLVTTAAGRSSITIHFSQRTAGRLAHMKSVTLIIRLVVRNAASHTPATTTVLSKVTLTH